MCQCCETITIYCGTGTDFGKVLIPDPNPEKQDFVQYLAFLMLKVALKLFT
jgi:hypothetical protein